MDQPLPTQEPSSFLVVTIVELAKTGAQCDAFSCWAECFRGRNQQKQPTDKRSDIVAVGEQEGQEAFALKGSPPSPYPQDCWLLCTPSAALSQQMFIEFRVLVVQGEQKVERVSALVDLGADAWEPWLSHPGNKPETYKWMRAARPSPCHWPSSRAMAVEKSRQGALFEKVPLP